MTMSMWEYEMAAKIRAASKGFYTVTPDEQGDGMVAVNLKKDSEAQITAQYNAEANAWDRDVIPSLILGNVELNWTYSNPPRPLIQTRKYDL